MHYPFCLKVMSCIKSFRVRILHSTVFPGAVLRVQMVGEGCLKQSDLQEYQRTTTSLRSVQVGGYSWSSKNIPVLGTFNFHRWQE